ncbi:helix-turn-helix domain-containing protein [Brevundimonas sp. 374]|uniref:helix-turn-helix domain-containing protein n=1 Tax=Brevundimonas sp. 374 TaxID=1150400 RepID=UPI00088A1313|nr:helix-turn-helix transcriptional regulator [Brevundimonas sp. 374]SDQ79990.1 Helix-turn-helix [Brevundimonas sp. 374]
MSEHEKQLDVAIGKAIGDRREAVGMTQRRLGDAIGVTFQQVQKYEGGRNRIAASKLVLAAKALKCDVAELVGEDRGDHPGSARLIRAWSSLNEKQREAVTTMIEAFE